MPDYAGVPDFSDYINLADPHNPRTRKDDSAMPDYNSYGTGKGGACATVWGDLPSYWCSNVSAGGWAFVDKAAAKAGRLNLPAGLLLASNSSFQRRVEQLWNNQQARGAIFHIAHSQGWAWHMFNVSHIINDDTNSTIAFDAGGWQGGRNWQCHNNKGLTDCNGANSDDKQLHGGPWYVEGVKEELDAPGEFYWDAASRKLYFYPPNNNCDDNNNKGTCQPPDLIASNLKTLFKIEGTQENPVRNIKFEGIRLRDAAKTIMEQWAAPSGGDWALYRGGAIHMEGTENITISDCQFRRLDGNAIMFGGYNRHAHVTRSDFSWLGEGAMATWGDTNGYDATGGAQTRMSIIEHNVMSNLGLYQKQSSAWGQNKACQNIIRNNVMFNLPRAAINFNDGLGGGNLVEGNVIFNACRESGDHGPINSWDRMPFLSETTGVPSFSPLPTETRHNLIWANYGAAEGFDNDDGSSYYYTHHNAYYESDGFKMDYGGHSSNFTNNLVFSNGRKKCYGTASFKEGQGDLFANNTCIVARQNNDPPKLGHMFQCALYGMKPTFNRYFTNTGNGTFACGNQQALTLQAIQQQGYEVGSTLNPMPPATTILAWARDILKTTANHQIKRTKDDASY
ncbi:expressed unknown protein [Seminavis robusta]|uniref:Right handed beta helix domain-containing protein n=1 Tax=Seminavis robusta TaxID=568900 RepID=A0A9N8EK45_9STRA|nr:expressed unknown protein [Seminavis robusta]|eukprot:Sro1130_g244510.1 n/a (622) ;mRNA; f:19377-21446